MAIKKYRVLHGSHAVPNPKFKQGDDTSSEKSHIEVPAGDTFDIEEARAVAFTTGVFPRLREVGKDDGKEVISSAPPAATKPTASNQPAATPPANPPATK